jgi:DNA-binding transcriptional MerR regulator
MGGEKYLLSTGQFAQVMGVSKETLFHYDRIGIFQPKVRRDNGYRYYSINQADTLSVILTLKELEYSLEEIHEYIKGRSPEKLVALLDDELQAIDLKINELRTMKQVLLEKRNLTQEATLTPIDTTVFVEKRERTPIIQTEIHHNKDLKEDLAIFESFTTHYEKLSERNFTTTLVHGFVLSKEKAREQEYMSYSHIFTRSLEKEQANANLSKGYYLSTFGKESNNNLGELYQRILDFAAEKEYELGDVFFEEVLLDELSIKHADDYLYKLSILIVEGQND